MVPARAILAIVVQSTSAMMRTILRNTAVGEVAADWLNPIFVRSTAPRTIRTGIGKVVNLSSREFQLLRYFLEHPRETLTREELLTQVWGYSERMFTRTVDVHVASLRQKLEASPKQPKFFLTVQGLGYKFKP